VPVGTQDPHAFSQQQLHQGWMGVPVRVVDADADQSDPRVDVSKHLLVLVGRPVVGDLDDVCP
jgi:hypothetical protein